MDRQTYLSLLRAARRRTHHAGEEADLLQTALLAALEAQRLDLSRRENSQWLGGVLRNCARQDARSAVRRRSREASFALAVTGEETDDAGAWRDFVLALPPALRTTALLVLTGHTKAEVMWLLSLSDAAFRKRTSEIRQRWRRLGGPAIRSDGALQGGLSFGLLRQALLRPVRSSDAALGTHDPDGRLFVVCSQKPAARQLGTSGI